MLTPLLHLQEVPEDQHRLEPHFYLEGPKSKNNVQRKGLKSTFMALVGPVLSWEASPWTRAAQGSPHAHLDPGGPETTVRRL